MPIRISLVPACATPPTRPARNMAQRALRTIMLFEEINALNRKTTYKQVPHEPAEAGPKAAPAQGGYFLRDWSSEIDGWIAASRHIRGRRRSRAALR